MMLLNGEVIFFPQPGGSVHDACHHSDYQAEESHDYGDKQQGRIQPGAGQTDETHGCAVPDEPPNAPDVVLQEDLPLTDAPHQPVQLQQGQAGGDEAEVVAGQNDALPGGGEQTELPVPADGPGH